MTEKIGGPRPSVERHGITFASRETWCDGDLYLPARCGGRLACVVMANGFGGTRDLGLPRYAERFAEHGLAVVAFDYAGFGSSGGHPRHLVEPARQLADCRAAVEFARADPRVDPEQIVLWGVSLGAGHAMEIAVRDRRIAAVVALTPFTRMTFGMVSRRRTSGTVRLLATLLVEAFRVSRGADPLTIPVVGTAEQMALITDPEDQDAFARLAEHAPLWRNEIALRGLLKLLLYRPGRVAGRLTMPLFVGTGRRDSAVSSSAAAAVAARAPRGELRRYAAGHFACFEGRVFELAVTDQLAFLNRYVLRV